MRRYKGWGRIKIAKELGISPNTVGSWIKTKGEIPRLVDEFEYGIYLYRIIDCKRIIEEEKEKGIMPKEKAEEGLKGSIYTIGTHLFLYPITQGIKE